MTNSKKNKEDASRFEQEIQLRNIERLIHFTHTDNLLSIFEWGAIYSRKKLEDLSIEHPQLYMNDYVEVNDGLRLDNLRDHINLSIQYPNTSLLNRFRERSNSSLGGWCLIEISPELILRSDAIFSIGNAASKLSKNHGICGTFENFQSLFSEKVLSGSVNNCRTLTRAGLAPNIPTDEQAEVLLPGSIPIEGIAGIIFESNEQLQISKGAINLMSSRIPPCRVERSAFSSRGL
jgi:hypothetical protein